MAKKNRRTGRGSNMGSDYKKAKSAASTGKKWIVLPDGWELFSEEVDTLYSFDFLPYIVKNTKEHPEGDSMSDDVWYRFPYRVHRKVGADNKDYICPETFGLPCPRCERVREIYNDTSLNKKKARALAGKYSASRRSLYIVKVVGGKGEGWDKKLKNKKYIFDASDFLFWKLLDKELGMNDPDTRNFACLESGYTCEVRFSAEEFEKNTYPKPDRIDFKPRKDYPESILDKNPDLGEIIKEKLPTYQELVDADKDGGGSGGGAGSDIPSDSDIEDMDFDDLERLVEDLDLNSEIDPDDYDEDTEDDFRADLMDIIHSHYGSGSNTESPESSNSSDSDIPSKEDVDDMDYDELTEVVENLDLDDIDPDDFDEDEEDEVEEFREEVHNSLSNLSKQSGDSGGGDLADEIDDAESFKELRDICKENDIFDDLEFKKFKKKPEKLKKKMLKLLNAGGSQKRDSGGKCPHGHKFGNDWAEFDECEEGECAMYKKCWEKSEEDVPF